jgi:hypothetical protein
VTPSDQPDKAAYRAELRRVARPVRFTGIGLALLGFVIGLSRFWMDPWPNHLRIAALFLCLAGIALMAVGVIIRTRYHMRRMAQAAAREQDQS